MQTPWIMFAKCVDTAKEGWYFLVFERRRMMLSRFALSLLVLVLACPSVEAGSKAATYGDVSAVIVSNYDGDTLTVDIPEYPPVIGKGMKVRVRHIDTPELKDRDPRAFRAKSLVETMCPPGSVVVLRNIGRDMYFRFDADVNCGGKDVATELVGAGLANDGYEGGKKEAW